MIAIAQGLPVQIQKDGVRSVPKDNFPELIEYVLAIWAVHAGPIELWRGLRKDPPFAPVFVGHGPVGVG